MARMALTRTQERTQWGHRARRPMSVCSQAGARLPLGGQIMILNEVQSPSRPYSERPVMTNKRILLVDDDPAVREMLGRVLGGEGYRVLPAADGAEALRITRCTTLDLVMLDLNMPVMDGWEAFEALREENPLLPVIIITAKPGQFFTSLGAGVGALFEKPFDFPKLLKTISTLLQEPLDNHLARMEGKPAAFYYLPAGNHAESL
jgi:CheY-like chemotaxis protein